MHTLDSLRPEITFDTLSVIDLRVGKIISAAAVEGSDKLLDLSVDLGPLGIRRIFSGIAKSYALEVLVNKHVVVVANLKPRKMRFGESEGMILAAGSSDDAVVVVELNPDRSRPGDRIS